jgi:CHAT domain-containing protein
MEPAKLAALLASSGAAERAALVARHALVADTSLARALNALYVETISSDPPRAAGAAAALASLAARDADPEVRALADWTSGMAALQIVGSFELAIGLIDSASARFDALGQPDLAAATQTGKIHALALLGRYDEAIACGELARTTLLAHGDTLVAGKIEQNLGNIYHRRDQYDQAEQHYSAAREHFLAAGDQRLLAFAENGLANVLALQHRARAAARLYEQARGRAAAVGAAVTQAEIECNLGCLALFQGRYDQALGYLEQSRRRYAALGMAHHSILAELELADAHLELNLVAEAAATYARIVPLLAELGMRADQARALANHGRACVALGRTREAQTLIAEARVLYQAEGNEVGAALAALADARIDYASGRFVAVALAVARAETILSAAEAWGHMLLARWLRGEALRAMGRVGAAGRLLEATLHDSQTHDLPQIAWRCHTSLGLLAAAGGDSSRAEASFQQAVTLIESLRAPLPAEEFRAAFIADKLTPYSELARLYLEPGAARAAQALDYVERARARALLDMLRGEPRGRAEPRDQADAELLARLEAAREELNWCYNQIDRLPDGGAARAESSHMALQRSVRDQEALVKEITRQLQQRGQPTPLAFDAEPLDLADLQRILGPDAALVEYMSLDDEVLAFVITGERVDVVRGLARNKQIAAALARFHFQISALRHGAALHHEHSDQLIQRIQHHMGALYKLLLEPIEARLGTRNLIVAPYGALYYIPFHALHDGVGYVVERREVSYTPSAQIFRHAATQPRRPLERALLLGVPDARAPQLRDEVEALAPLFAQAIMLLGERATLAALREHAPSADLLHLACHGRFRRDNPLFSALRLADGHLTMRDIYGLNLRCELAILSACETGLSAIAPGDELFGLARGFFAAGVPTLLVSLWAVDDESTAALMTHFYQRLLAGDRPATALRQAQLALMRRDVHPFFWAPFILLGRP